jgi:multisubunit Na+/H+ antiporter MnhB subunit
MSGFAFDVALCLLLLAVALAAIGARDLFAGIAFFIAYGVLIALAWLRLGATDVAMAEAAIGAGLTGVLLIGAWSRLGAFDAKNERPPSFAARSLAALGATGIAGLLGSAVLLLPPREDGLARAVAEDIAATGVENPVTAVLLNFRAFDTLLESIVLLAALVAVWALTPNEIWGRRPGLRQHARADGVMSMFGRLLPPVGLMVAVYLVWAGSDMPGGAFQAGTVLAATFLLILMSGLADLPRQTDRGLLAALAFGPAVFLGVGLVGAVFGTFLAIPSGFAKTIIVTIEFALALSIAVTLVLLVAGTPKDAGR